jgi:hypothetical protein
LSTSLHQSKGVPNGDGQREWHGADGGGAADLGPAAGTRLSVGVNRQKSVSSNVNRASHSLEAWRGLKMDFHPDAHACRLKLSLATMGFDTEMRCPWCESGRGQLQIEIPKKDRIFWVFLGPNFFNRRNFFVHFLGSIILLFCVVEGAT